MMITVTDKGMAAHEYARSCKCRGCVAVRKAKLRAGLWAAPVVVLVWFLTGFFFGHVLGSFTGIVAALLGFGVFQRLNPDKEVLKADSTHTE